MSSILKDDQYWTTIIEPPSKKAPFDLRKVWTYKYLVFLFIKRDFTTAYKQTILGPLWFILQPLMTSGIFSIIFAGIANIPTESVPAPLFYLAGTTIWGFFSSVLTSNSTILSGNVGLFSKVYFPRLAVPIANSVSRLYQFSIQFVFFVVVFIVYMLVGANVHPNLNLLAIPFVLLQLGILGMGIGLWISAWTVKYRDLSYLVSFGISLWMWITPIPYPMSFVTNDLLRKVIWLNPVAPSVELFRVGFTGAGSIDPLWVLYGWAWSLLMIFIGLIKFSKAERTYVDVV